MRLEYLWLYLSPPPVSVFPTRIFCACVSQSPSWCWNKKIFLSLQYFDYIYPRPEHGPDTAISEMARVNYLFISNARHLFKKWSLFLKSGLNEQRQSHRIRSQPVLNCRSLQKSQQKRRYFTSSGNSRQWLKMNSFWLWPLGLGWAWVGTYNGL